MFLKIIQVVAALAFVLSLIGIVSILLRKFENKTENSFGKKRRLKTIETLNLGGNKKICIIEQDGEEHLVGVSDNGISMLEKNIKNNIIDGEKLHSKKSKTIG